MANWVRYPLPLSPLGDMEVRYPPPPQKGYLSDIGAIPHEGRQNGCDTALCDATYLEKVLRDMGRYLALGR